MNQNVRYGLVLLLLAVVFLVIGGDVAGDVGLILGVLGVAMCVIGLLRPSATR